MAQDGAEQAASNTADQQNVAAGSQATGQAANSAQGLADTNADLYVVSGGIALADMSAEEKGLKWQKPEEVKQAQGSKDLPAGKVTDEQKIAAGLILEEHRKAEMLKEKAEAAARRRR